MKTREEILSCIARYLMLYGSFISNIGLLNGKTGIAVFFYHYARHTGKKRYDDFAGELIDEIYKEIHRDTPCNFRDGLCGIAWGIEYLIRNQFVEADPDKVLIDLDKQIRERDVRQTTDYTLETGLKGIACYVISRLANRKSENSLITLEYIQDLITALGKEKKEDEAKTLLIRDLEKIIDKEEIVRFYNPLFRIVNAVRYQEKSLFQKPHLLGIDKNGYAGIGLQLMKVHKP
ncbi:MAG: hypothetical protein LBI60_00290 [Bacteroidales bacterium]|jgi:hypothetical protein|nr:hypothetical protein [Bacteroidales bacterium]